MKNVPASYLLWLQTQNWLAIKFPDLAEYVDDREEHLIAEVKDLRSVWLHK